MPISTDKFKKEQLVKKPYNISTEGSRNTLELHWLLYYKRTNYAALWDTFNAAMNATLGFDSTQVSMLFLLAYANGEFYKLDWQLV